MIGGNVVKEFNLDNTRIIICDDCCRDKQPGDLQTILDHISHNVQNQLAMHQEQTHVFELNQYQ